MSDVTRGAPMTHRLLARQRKLRHHAVSGRARMTKRPSGGRQREKLHFQNRGEGEDKYGNRSLATSPLSSRTLPS